ncbi:tRNA (adenosine(37)-N6)-threonylcarbamoyltransferase complex ATPase subunit type 1 TsaE [Jiella sp. MQZ9-1]|uniref:tRNA threonylcarbamoyladenosine biosynthesis protein TsaE n=1 Tax=Jiella flava TaxID=2816857 RepID=A0A939G1D4_9HYPH|nr:tRNA (adenosine(37)-N6)-threonylcarbamoyltransferase complex ATPase subunit type 1 TsaE [Jiella flava]MBO0663239.1 tRNA (adenosine(37)-N6)-threonylcarbamoyltransferase complex ATPase subunit type 1 TsaE [Jiella flava]MCD2471815.1 tRNA (adenosine(37)-N6)-threonylcarbamoyltransferase complex ATPase subunit type 1 TsaE [Jiella flava]
MTDAIGGTKDTVIAPGDKGRAATARSTSIARLVLPDTAATERLGADLAVVLAAGDVIALSGDLGAGKSTLARALIRALAGDPQLEVPSPTYTLVQPYDTEPPVAHFDLYRLAKGEELDELGFDDAAATGIALVEWPERAEADMACATVAINLTLHETGGRVAVISAAGNAQERISRTLAIRGFLSDAGLDDAPRARFFGDASTRRYETLTANGVTFVLMDAPRRPDGPPIKNGLPYSRIAHLAEDVAPFVAVADALRQAGFAAPAIRRADLDSGLLLTEYLGDGGIIDADRRPIPQRYHECITCLAALHQIEWSAELPFQSGAIYRLPRFDRGAMTAEIELLVDWYVPYALGRAASDDERRLFTECWTAIFDELQSAETSLVLRDFHSPNVIYRPEAEGIQRIGLIDFQDALIGPAAYDVASLAQDARTDVSADLEAALTAAYISHRREQDPAFAPFAFERDYAIIAAQRASKILGIFVRLLQRDHKPQYLRHIPRIKTYLARTLGHPSLSALRRLYGDWGIFDHDDPGRHV